MRFPTNSATDKWWVFLNNATNAKEHVLSSAQHLLPQRFQFSSSLKKKDQSSSNFYKRVSYRPKIFATGKLVCYTL